MAGSGKAHLREDADTLLHVEDLTVEFPVGGGNKVHAVSGISFDIERGETLGLVGESGCGKSTTGRAILQLPRPTSGEVRLKGEDLTQLGDDDMRARRTNLQMIFQDPISSLNPRRTIGDVVAEPLNVWGPKDSDEQTVKERALAEPRVQRAIGDSPIRKIIVVPNRVVNVVV